MSYCKDCEKCKRTYDVSYFPEFCPWCYTKYDELKTRADKLVEALKQVNEHMKIHEAGSDLHFNPGTVALAEWEEFLGEKK